MSFATWPVGKELFQSGDGEYAGRFGNCPGIFVNILHCRADLVIVDSDDFVEQARANIESEVTGTSDSDTLGEMSDPVQGHRLSRIERSLHRCGFLRLNADEPDPRMQVLADQGHPGSQAATADTDKQVVDGCMILAKHFQRNSRLPGDDIRVIVGVDENPAAFLRQFHGFSQAVSKSSPWMITLASSFSLR